MNAMLVEALRQLQIKPGETVTVDVDGRELEIRDATALADDGYSMLPAPPFPDPPAVLTARVKVGPPDLPDPIRSDVTDLAPGFWEEEDDLPGRDT